MADIFHSIIRRKEIQTKMRKLVLFYLIVILCSLVYGKYEEEEEEEEGGEDPEEENKEPVMIKIGEIVSNWFVWI